MQKSTKVILGILGVAVIGFFMFYFGNGDTFQGRLSKNLGKEDSRKTTQEEAKKTEEERRKAAAEEASKKAAQEEAKKAAKKAAQEEAKKAAEEEAAKKAAEEEAAKKAAEEEAAKKAAEEEAAKKAAEEEAAKKAAEEEAAKKAAEEKPYLDLEVLPAEFGDNIVFDKSSGNFVFNFRVVNVGTKTFDVETYKYGYFRYGLDAKAKKMWGSGAGFVAMESIAPGEQVSLQKEISLGKDVLTSLGTKEGDVNLEVFIDACPYDEGLSHGCGNPSNDVDLGNNSYTFSVQPSFFSESQNILLNDAAPNLVFGSFAENNFIDFFEAKYSTTSVDYALYMSIMNKGEASNLYNYGTKCKVALINKDDGEVYEIQEVSCDTVSSFKYSHIAYITFIVKLFEDAEKGLTDPKAVVLPEGVGIDDLILVLDYDDVIKESNEDDNVLRVKFK
ncbi:hypothetical protein HY604_02685 [Candidatus Peregrinibacteria bacterium]|nr:hypothetical protein [Candidatus Peregrinibacteria bacterium]